MKQYHYNIALIFFFIITVQLFLLSSCMPQFATKSDQGHKPFKLSKADSIDAFRYISDQQYASNIQGYFWRGFEENPRDPVLTAQLIQLLSYDEEQLEVDDSPPTYIDGYAIPKWPRTNEYKLKRSKLELSYIAAEFKICSATPALRKCLKYGYISISTTDICSNCMEPQTALYRLGACTYKYYIKYLTEGTEFNVKMSIANYMIRQLHSYQRTLNTLSRLKKRCKTQENVNHLDKMISAIKAKRDQEQKAN